MSWRNKDDLGTQLIAHVHESLHIPNDFTVDQDRGFEWWAADYAQRVWSDLGNFHNSSTLYRLHAEIDFLRGNGHAEAALPALATLQGHGSLSAFVYDREKDLYKFHCSVYANDENEGWIRRVLNAAVALQITEVKHNAQPLAKEFKLAHQMTEHPHHGARKTPDQICDFEERFFKPYGKGDSRWMGVEEWDEGRQALRRIANDVKTDYKMCLEAEFDWIYGQRNMSLLVSAVDPHPTLGQGLMFILRLPVMMDDGHKAQVALDLNEAERSEWNWYSDFGSWGLREGELAFVCFVPNICFVPGVLKDFAHDMGLRANWVLEHWSKIVNREWVLG